MEAALDAAARAAKPDGGVVLLSPACASFDQFRSFEHRGDVFRDLVTGPIVEGDGLMVSRAETTAFARWWWTVDKTLLFALLALIAWAWCCRSPHRRPSPSATATARITSSSATSSSRCRR